MDSKNRAPTAGGAPRSARAAVKKNAAAKPAETSAALSAAEPAAKQIPKPAAKPIKPPVARQAKPAAAPAPGEGAQTAGAAPKANLAPDLAGAETLALDEFAKLAERMSGIAGDYWREKAESGEFQVPDPGVIGKLFLKATMGLLSEPEQLAQRQGELVQGLAAIWQNALQKASNADAPPAEPVAAPAPEDRRFQDEAWNDPYFDFLKQSYLLTSRWLQATLPQAPGLDPKTAKQVDFFTRQLTSALSPSNFIATNPVALKKSIESKGETLRKGLANLLGDLERGKGRLAISMTDASAFKVGENIATAPGKVIFQNRMLQLIQYAPSTETVFRRPLLVVPPWINKFYIMDLKPQNSLVRWLVAQGHTVFMVSWVNPDASYADVGFDDYMTDGVLAALNAIEQATGEREVNAIGYCIGGTLMAATLAYMAAKNDNRVKSATFFTALTDFTEAGELLVFIDEEQLALMKKHMQEKGYLESHHMAQVFNMLRERDLIWSFVVNNYLLGRDPMAFDLLYWNSDSTRMPAKMHEFYIRQMYMENRLAQPGGIAMKGVPVDLRKIEIPVFQLSTREDHIAPWKATYALSQLVKGPYKFVLAGSGHIAGVINPPPSTKYGYWTNDRYPADRDAWLEGAAHHEGSWWPVWGEWAASQAPEKVPARIPGAGKLKPIEDAPGSYVKAKAD